MVIGKKHFKSGQNSLMRKISDYKFKRHISTAPPESIGKQLVSLLNPRSAPNPELPASGLQWEPKEEVGERRDRLPRTKPELEVRLNYHLEELDRLKGYVQKLNDTKREHEARVQNVKARVGAEDMSLTIKRLEQLVQSTVDARKAYGAQIGYNRVELERIAERFLQIQRSNGEQPVMPEVFARLANEYEWMSLFLV